MSRSAPLIVRLSSLVAGEAAPKERVRVILRAIQDSASSSAEIEVTQRPPFILGEGGKKMRGAFGQLQRIGPPP